ncbi:hypothetical protein NDU88_009539 [Pleurodeles waltl]|uniref:Uncharacterized protein n=1 Tax=Pleurodeles waltl TaxID=8319 RepID=A0AAV7P8C3_PLEWA|nr:hypothetical protein NDU88_009539 [Pleurodeles waltl]
MRAEGKGCVCERGGAREREEGGALCQCLGGAPHTPQIASRRFGRLCDGGAGTGRGGAHSAGNSAPNAVYESPRRC